MKVEYEAKALNINKNSIRKRLKKIDAKLIFHETKFVRQTFQNAELRKRNAWIRLQKGNGTVKLALKIAKDKTSVDGLLEREIEVSSFEQTQDLLLTLGYEKDMYEEKLREEWELDGITFDIDTWPEIPTFVEIEGANEDDVKKGFERMNLDYNRAFFGPISELYTRLEKIDA